VPEGVEYSVKIAVVPYDVAKAKQLLAEAGYRNGFETELWSGYNHSVAQPELADSLLGGALRPLTPWGSTTTPPC